MMISTQATLLTAWLTAAVVVGQGGQEVTLGEHSYCQWRYEKMGCKKNCNSGWQHYKTTNKGCCSGPNIFTDCGGNMKHCRKRVCSQANRGKIWKFKVPASGNLNLPSGGAWNDKVSSYTLDDDCQLTLFEHPNYQGSQWKFGWGKKDNWPHDKASSMKISCKNDCKWKPWSGWERCSHTCGSRGIQHRRRSTYPATHGGRACSEQCFDEEKSYFHGKFMTDGLKALVYQRQGPWEWIVATKDGKWVKMIHLEIDPSNQNGYKELEVRYIDGDTHTKCQSNTGFTLAGCWKHSSSVKQTTAQAYVVKVLTKPCPAPEKAASVESRPCNRNIKCPITKIECSDFQLPNEAELPQFCTDTFVDVITVDSMITGGTTGMVKYTRGTQEQMERSTTSGFSSEFGWDFSKADREWDSVTDSTEILIKDPEVSMGFKALSGGHSCFNKNSAECTARGALGVGSSPMAAFFSPGGALGANILGGLMDKMADHGSNGNEDPDKCKCKETTTTVTKEKGSEHTTTVGRMMRQGQTMEQTFARSKMKHSSQEYTLECPPWSECAHATYSVTSICAIPYWGTCKATRSDGRVDNFTIERDDTKNLYYTKQTQPRTYAFSGVTEITTDGAICGVKLTPAIDIPHHHHTPTCPKPNEISSLPNCDCMLPEYKDCGTPDGTLKNGQWCLLNVREVADNEICIRSQPHWSNVSSCFSRDVFVVSDYNLPVYQRLKEAIQLGDASSENEPKYYKYTLRGSTGTEAVKVNGKVYVLSKSERAFLNEGPTVEIEFMNDGHERGEDRNVFLKRTEGSFTLVPDGGSALLGYNGWNCGTKSEDKRCALIRSGGMYWSGPYKATLSGGASKPSGECVCTGLYDPVCGEDGKTYSNDCQARCQVKNWTEGECDECRTESRPCNSTPDRKTCLTSRDSRNRVVAGKNLKGQRCVWCPEGACHKNNANRCEPEDWLKATHPDAKFEASCEEFSGAREYLGCYVNKGADRVNGHMVNLTFEECEARAGSRAFLGMEYPQHYREAGHAQCLLLPGGLPSMQKVADQECEQEIDSRGRRLGGRTRLAVYGQQGLTSP